MKILNKSILSIVFLSTFFLTVQAQNINEESLWIKPKNPVAKGSESNKNLQAVVAFFQTYGKGDYEAIKKVVASDVEWHIPGKHKLAGTKKEC